MAVPRLWQVIRQRLLLRKLPLGVETSEAIADPKPTLTNSLPMTDFGHKPIHIDQAHR